MTDAGGSLCELLADDQAEDRAVVAGTAAYAALRQRDADRRKRVLHLLAAAPPGTAQDLYAAAWVLNHGDSSAEAFRAHQLAARADQLGCRKARWLAAAALDRSLMYSGRPQKFGSNIVPDGTGAVVGRRSGHNGQGTRRARHGAAAADARARGRDD